MSDWNESNDTANVDTVDNMEPKSNVGDFGGERLRCGADNNDFKKNNEEGQNKYREYNRNENNQNFDPRRRNFNNNNQYNTGDNNGEQRRGRRDDNQQNDNQNNDGERRRGRRDDNQQNDNQNKDGEGRRGRRDDNQQNDNQNNDGERRRGRRDDNQQNDYQNNDGERRRGRRDDNQQSDNQNNDGERRRGRRDDNQQSDNQNNDGERRRGRRDDNQQSDNQNNDSERRRGRRDDNQQSDNQNNDGERRRGRRNDGDNDAPITEKADGEKPTEIYIPRQYNKDDADLYEGVGEGINFANFNHIPVQVSGENIPDPIKRFSEIAKDENVIKAIKQSGYKTLTPIQKYGIPIIMNGRDLMGSAQTGSGKTMAFLLPIVQNLIQDQSCKNYGDKCSPQCLIITPTRELAIQIFEQAYKLTCKTHIISNVVYGGANLRDQTNRIQRGSNIVVATPGRLIQLLEKETISLENVKFFVLDEADRMIDAGFIPSVKRVVHEFDMPTNRHTLMFSATFPNEVQILAQTFLKPDYIFLSVGVLGAANEDVKQEVLKVEFRNKLDELLNILRDIYNQKERILIFCGKKKMADFLAGRLLDNDFKSTSIHGDRLQSQREKALETFKKGETPILVATSVAARGLDIKGVTYVINYDLPTEIEEYVHRIGRTGRVGNSGTAISFYNERDDEPLASKLAKLLFVAKQQVPDFLKSYLDSNLITNDSTEKDTRQNNAEKSENFSNRTDKYSGAAASVEEDDDW